MNRKLSVPTVVAVSLLITAQLMADDAADNETKHLPDGPYAKVVPMLGGRFVVLTDDSTITNDARYFHWAKIPSAYADMMFLRNKSQQGTTKFHVKSAGTVLMAVTTRWSASGRGGDWQKELVTQKDLESGGWRVCGKLNSYMKENGERHTWILFARSCMQGETFSYRTEKYVAPVLLLK